MTAGKVFLLFFQKKVAFVRPPEVGHSIRAKLSEQTAAGIFQQVQDFLEPLGTAVVRIWNLLRRVTAEIICHAHYFPCRMGIGRQLVQGTLILRVHSDQEVEAPEVVPPHRPRPVHKLIAARTGMPPHPLIGQFPFMIIYDPSRSLNKIRQIAYFFSSLAYFFL